MVNVYSPLRMRVISREVIFCDGHDSNIKPFCKRFDHRLVLLHSPSSKSPSIGRFQILPLPGQQVFDMPVNIFSLCQPWFSQYISMSRQKKFAFSLFSQLTSESSCQKLSLTGNLLRISPDLQHCCPNSQHWCPCAKQLQKPVTITKIKSED